MMRVGVEAVAVRTFIASVLAKLKKDPCMASDMHHFRAFWKNHPSDGGEVRRSVATNRTVDCLAVNNATLKQ